MKRVLLYLGMGSCVSAEDQRSQVAHSNSSMKIVKSSSFSTKNNTVQTPVGASPGVNEEVFFDSKPWLESDDEDFLSVDGDYTPYKAVNNVGDHQGRRLSELFRESSFSSDSPTSQKANAEANGNKDQKPETPKTMKIDRKKSGRSTQRCLPSLVRSLSCGDRKKRLSPVHIAVVG